MDNEELAELEPLSRLLFIYLWMLADREGRLEDRPKRIAAQALAYDRTADVGSMLDSLQRAGFITRFTANGIACIQIVSFHKHQNPHVREAASELPCMEQSTSKVVPDTDQGKVEPSPRSPDPGSRIPDSPSLIVGSVATATDTPPPKKKQKAIETRLPEDFGVSNRVMEWAKKKGFDRLPEHLEAFRSKAKAKGYTYVDWDEALMNAIREDWAKLRVTQGYAAIATTTVPSRPGVDPALAKCIADSLTCKGPPPEIRSRMKQLAGARR